jgi:hypothetical protein
MKSELKIDADRGKQLAHLLYDCFSTTGVLGNTEMPEDILPAGMEKGSLEHLLFITLTVSIDYQRDANAMWAVSRKTFEDPDILRIKKLSNIKMELSYVFDARRS